jgi:glycosyltransferase involved in cell wall biosynthesis
MDNPLVSVIICVYNGAAFLADAIDCVLKQNYPETELIVVDDGSTDNSAKIAASYPQVKLVSHEDNRGLPSARNTGIQTAAGEYIAFLDADDLWPPNKISAQVKFHQEHPEYKYSYTQERFRFEDMQERPNWSQKQAFQEDHVAYCAGSMLFHQSLFEIVGQFNPMFRNGDTTEWVFRAKDQGFVGGIVEEVLLFRRIHDQNLSSRVSEENKMLLKAVKSSIDRQRQSRGQ